MDDPGSWCSIVAVTDGLICFAAAIVFVVLTTFFSVTTLALRYISWVKLEEAFENDGRIECVARMRRQMSQLTAGAVILRLMANLALLLSMVYYFASAQAIRPLFAAFVVSAAVLVVFSLAIPHAWARYGGTSFLVRCFPVLMAMAHLAWPVIVVLRAFDSVIRRLIGISADESNGRLDEKQEELLNVVEQGEKEGVVDEEERDMIASVLEFRDQTAGEIMTPRTDVVGIDADVDLATAAKTITDAGHSRYPVYEESIDKIIGMLYAKDLLHDLNEPDKTKGIKHRLRRAYFVPESKALRDLLHDFQDQKVHLAVVLDEYGGTAGVVTIEDIVEELVGEIVDEYEAPQEEPIKQIDPNTIEIDARVHVDELNDKFDLTIPEDDDYETIGGFAFTKLGYIPKKGETFEHDNIHLTIIDVEQRKINRVRIVIREKEEDSNNRKKMPDREQ